MTIKNQILLSFGITILLIILAFYIQYSQANTTHYAFEKVTVSNRAEQQITEKILNKIEPVIDLIQHEQQPMNSDYVVNVFEEVLDLVEELREATEAGEALAEERGDEDEEEEEEEELEAIARMQEAVNQLLTRIRSDASYMGEATFHKLMIVDIHPIAEMLYEDALEEFEVEFEEIHQSIVWISKLTVILLIICLVILVTIALKLASNITAPIRQQLNAYEMISRGDFRARIDYKKSNEFGKLADSFNLMAAELNRSTLSKRSVDLVIEALPSPLFLLDKKKKISRINKQAQELFGYESNELLGTVFHVFSHLEFDDKQESELEFRDVQLNNKAGKQIPCDIGIRCLKTYTGEKYYTITFQDLRPFKLVEQSLVEARNAAEESNEFKSHFLASISHEIRTPMNGVVATSELLLDTELTDYQRSFIKTLKSSADNLIIIINDLLDFSKIEAGKMELYHENLSLWMLLEECVSILSTQAYAKGLEILLDVGDNVPKVISADPVRLRQIITNLLGNAVKFTHRGLITLRVNVISSTENTANLLFEVIDTGIGIKKEDHRKVFESFSRTREEYTRKVSGTGLGLSISNHLLALMNSKLQLESEVKKGSRFYFELNCTIEGEETPDIETVSVGSALVAGANDDEEAVIEKNLNRCGYTTELIADEKLNESLETDGYELLCVDAEAIFRNPNLLRKAERSDLKILLLMKIGDILDSDELFIPQQTLIVRKPILPSEIYEKLQDQSDKTTNSCSEQDTQDRTDNNYSILIVDDDAINRKIASTVLKKQGHEVTLAENGYDAIGLFCNNTFDAILMDIQMPGMDGFEATKKIREIEQLENLPEVIIIACTAHATSGFAKRCVDNNMNGYITKPIRVKAFSKEMSRIIEKEHQK
ncbi:MAG: ATP-binding protein [Opitutales bacterium]|nr:ATP-binding protein [Opitutales bacterium]